MNLTIGKRDVTPMAALLLEVGAPRSCEPCGGLEGAYGCEACGGFGLIYPTPEEVAKAVLQQAWEQYEAKGKFVVLGALVKDPAGRTDPITAERACFGPFGTQTQARAAEAQLFYSTATGEEFVRWLIPMVAGTPAAWFRSRKQAREAAEETAGDAEFTRAVPPHHQGTPERREAAEAAGVARIESNRQAAWERAMALRNFQQEQDPEVPRTREEITA